jgi:catechol 2,3-dioxygenase-like lactoylglutathione lyase family enzyme
MALDFFALGIRLWTPPEHFAATADFYLHALELQQSFRDDAQGIATFELGFAPATLVVERSERTPERAVLFGRFTGVVLHTLDVAAAYAQLTERGARFDGPPTRQPWGATMAFFRDPSGNELTLLQRPG